GGCGLAALAISRYLKKLGRKSQIKFVFIHSGLFSNKSEFRNNFEYIEKKNKNNNSNNDGLCVPNHIVIKYRGRYYDSDGKYDFDETCENFVLVEDEKDLLQTLNTPKLNGWNTRFYRPSAIEHFETNLEIDLCDIALKWKNNE
ncbi:MAG: hypothetical protein ACOCVF_04025, partial [bacterium]